MSGGGLQQQQATLLAKNTAARAKEAYDVGFGGLRAQQGLLDIAQPEPGFVRDAFEAQRAGIVEGGADQQKRDVQAQLAAQQQAAQGGNTSGNLTNDQLGARIAQALYSSRVQQGLGKVEQANKLLGMRMGQSVQAGNQALGAAGNVLTNISMMPNYNPTYANVLGAVNTAGAIYGGFQGARQQPSGGTSFGVQTGDQGMWGMPQSGFYPTNYVQQPWNPTYYGGGGSGF